MAELSEVRKHVLMVGLACVIYSTVFHLSVSLIYWFLIRELFWLWQYIFACGVFIIQPCAGSLFICFTPLLVSPLEWISGIDGGGTYTCTCRIISWISLYALSFFNVPLCAIAVILTEKSEVAALMNGILVPFLVFFILGIRMCDNKFEGWRALCAGMPAICDTTLTTQVVHPEGDAEESNKKDGVEKNRSNITKNISITVNVLTVNGIHC